MNTETLYFLINIFILAILIISLLKLSMEYRNIKYKYDKVYELSEILADKLDNSLEELKCYEEYISFFKTYCNEDWNRDTPFIEEIEVLSKYFSHSNTDKALYPLNKKIKEISITQQLMEDLKSIFKDYLPIILEMSLGEVLIFIADLKSYRESSSENGNKSPREFYNWRLTLSLIKNERNRNIKNINI